MINKTMAEIKNSGDTKGKNKAEMNITNININK